MDEKRHGPSPGETMHGSCAARNGAGVLLLGGSGAGKSDLCLRLMDRGFDLVADDRVRVVDGMAFPPAALAGLIEVRGLGLLQARAVFPARLALAVRLDQPEPRLPDPATHPALGLPMLSLFPFAASTPLRIELALDVLRGDRRLSVGFLRPGTQEPHG